MSVSTRSMSVSTRSMSVSTHVLGRFSSRARVRVPITVPFPFVSGEYTAWIQDIRNRTIINISPACMIPRYQTRFVFVFLQLYLEINSNFSASGTLFRWDKDLLHGVQSLSCLIPSFGETTDYVPCSDYTIHRK